MPWSNQKSGGGWKGGSGGPWGPRPGGPNQQPDLEEILRRGQDRIRQAMPSGRMGGPVVVMIALALVALVGFFGFTARVNPEELGVVLRFGKFVRLLPPGLNFRWPYPIEVVELPKVTRVNRIELGIRGSAENRETSAAVRDTVLAPA
jgi:modulator of FtsH protease HflK